MHRVKNAAQYGKNSGLIVAAGHGLTYRNVGALAEISEITEFNIGHNIISRSIFVGLNQAVREMIDAISINWILKIKKRKNKRKHIEIY